MEMRGDPYIKAFYVFPVTLNDVDQVVYRGILTKENLAVVDLIFMENIIHSFLWFVTELKCR